MPYLIDGHNLIGQLPDISLRDPDDEAKLVMKLRGFCARTGKKAHVIFDHGLPGGKSKLSNNTVTVTFAARPGEADDLMLQHIRRTKDINEWVVVSSDERVLSQARKEGIKTLRAHEFARQMVPPPAPNLGEHPNPHITRKEVEEWLKLFTEADDSTGEG
ncbi:MAG: NYN domain-containing protein [Phototrophicaceae bacterium]|jgi:predicted RNA-binding protein with PIN domain